MFLGELINIFKQLRETSSRTGKEAILKDNEGNNDFRDLLQFIYNPFVLTGIKDKKLQKFADFHDDNHPIQFGDEKNAMAYLLKNNSGRDEDVKAIANYINDHIEPETREFLREVFTKSLKIGISSSTINKVYGKGTIPEFDVMLAKAFKDHGHKLTGKFFVTLKLDGIRCIAIKKGKVQFFTRQGQPIDDLIEIEDEILHKFPDNFVLDGELLLNNDNNLDSADLFRATQKVVRKDGIKKNLHFHVFDGMPIEEFMEGKSKFEYETRRKMLQGGIFHIKYDTVTMLPVLYEGTDKSVISDLLAKVVAEGHEGLMVNTATGKYTTTRSGELLKVKEMHTVDLRVVGYEEGSGKLKGTLGALVVDYKGFEVKVGSGYTDGERNIIWNTMRDSIVGKIIEVQYFEESSNEDGGISLRFPVYKQIRDDKTEPSLH